jgi:DNA-binding NtrC family response regulator
VIRRVDMKIKTLREQEKEYILEILRWASWDLEKAARLLKISISRLKRKISKHGLAKEESGSDH